jgi:hypothetical protein
VSQDRSKATGCGFRDTFAFEAVRRFQPSALILMLGTNDAKEEPETIDRYLEDDLVWLMHNLTGAQGNPTGAFVPLG